MNLKQLANHLRLSPTTVSRALNGYPEVSEQTRQRVVQAAGELGYAPSHQARNLATGHSSTIGHLLPRSAHQMINPFFADFLYGAGEAYVKSGYDILLRMVSPETEEKDYRELAKSRKVDGFIVHGPLVNDPRIPMLQSLNIPFLVHGRCGNVAEAQYSWLDVDNINAFRRATDLLLDLGHRRIGLLNGLEQMNFASQRRQGYDGAMATRGFEVNPSWLFSADMTEPYGYSAMKELLGAERPVTAILCSSILSALGAQRALQEAGLTPGRDMSIVIFDDELSALSNGGEIPFFTALRSSISKAGLHAGNMLIDSIRNKDQGNRQQLWEAELILGKSTAPPRELT